MKFKTTSATNTFALALGLAACTIAGAQARTFSVVHDFAGQGSGDGAYPLNGFVTDAAGNMYSTASAGGTYNNGAVYKLTPTHVMTMIYSFKTGNDGSGPQGMLVRDKAGNLYGTTLNGGASGAGTVYRITPAGTEKVLYSFSGADGANPQAGVIRDAKGNLYGTTTAGGASGNGTVYELSPPAVKGGAWTEQVLYSFGSAPDGAVPVAGVNFDKSGNLYGTTSVGGGTGNGTVFQLVPSGSSWTENILHQFQYGNDGATPYAGLISDSAGNLYGAATAGGLPGGGGGGTIFELSPGASGWTFTTLYSLPGWNISGSFRDLIFDAAGNIYGTTHCDGADSSGTVYKLTRASGWKYTELYTFTGGSDGQYSFSNLVLRNGNLYGTTNVGGANGMGVVFELAK